MSLDKYMNDGFKAVEGWCSPMVADVLKVFYKNNLTSGVMEIGVHHGLLFMMMNSIVPRNSKSYPIDLFDDQHLNIDGSGSGNLKIFKNNLIQFDVHKGENCEIIMGDSFDHSKFNIIPDASISIISIDGGHTKWHVVNDLKIAQIKLVNDGIVIVDDFTNPGWPGVHEGVIVYLQQLHPLVPFAVGHNKLYLSKVSYQSQYLQKISSSNLFGKMIEMCGIKVFEIQGVR